MRALRLEPSLHLGIEAIDRQHGEMVDMINETQALLEAEESGDQLVQILNRFNTLCIDHFSTEEALMREAGYPDLAQHKKLHDGSLERAFGFDAASLGRDKEAGKALLQLLRDWLLAHIHADREMAHFLKAQGIR
ncbi:bacteriohemerythrin [Motiliproteus sp. SC1-56]|uniref:bacteriohemerythrin n=1 Tax=Motiliproteus sp. SC1-56 TaxID=2799565 RepID=UPI001A8F5549|nr:bacteriohemerythrin [Motiliproteus sp. SC1-56]